MSMVKERWGIFCCEDPLTPLSAYYDSDSEIEEIEYKCCNCGLRFTLRIDTSSDSLKPLKSAGGI